MLMVINDTGRKFNVRPVFSGDRYGLKDCLVHSGAPMIEFYDDTYAGAPAFGPRGQFVARYYAHTLAARPVTGALCMQGDVPEWVVSAANVRAALSWLLMCDVTWVLPWVQS